MPVKVVQGDLFDSSAQTLVNTVNCVGAMGIVMIIAMNI